MGLLSFSTVPNAPSQLSFIDSSNPYCAEELPVPWATDEIGQLPNPTELTIQSLYALADKLSGTEDGAPLFSNQAGMYVPRLSVFPFDA